MSDRRGLALISVIVSMAILMVALAMATTAFFSASRVTKHGAYFTMASNFTEGVLERVKAQPFDSIRTMDITTGLPKLPEAKCAVTVTTPEDGLKQVTATCSWTEGGSPRKVEFSTLVARGGGR